MRATAAILVAAAASSCPALFSSAFTAPPRRISISPPSARGIRLPSRGNVGPSGGRSAPPPTMALFRATDDGGARRRRAISGGAAPAALPGGPFRSTARLFGAVGRRTAGAVRAVRRAAAVLLAAAIVTFGTAPLSAGPVHATGGAAATTMTTTTNPAVVRLVKSRPSRTVLASTAGASANLDRLIERYVRQHMFSDDAYDPFESAYREAHYDQGGSPYPSIISETAADILGKKEVAAKVEREGSAFDKVWQKLDGLAVKLESKFGISKQLSLSTMFIGIFCTPVVVLFLGAIAFGEKQKAKSEQMAKDRYGYGLNDLSAAERIGEDIEAPDDDDDDEDDEDDEDED